MKLKKLHSLLAILLITAVVFSMMLLPGCRSSGMGAANLGRGKLSDMDDEALLQYIQDCGVTFPKDVRLDDPIHINTIRSMIRRLEKEPDHEAPFYSGLVYWEDVFEDLRKVVKSYYGIDA